MRTAVYISDIATLVTDNDYTAFTPICGDFKTPGAARRDLVDRTDPDFAITA
jgi:hypothetical protein